MPRYLCKREGKDIYDDLVINNVNIVRDLSRVWSNCIVYLDGKQMKVQGVYRYKDTPVMSVYPMTGGEAMLVTLDHPKLTITYPDMGYFNTPTSAVYLERKVSRQWKQGLHMNTLSILVPMGSVITRATNVDYFRFAGVGYRNTLDFHGFLDTFNMFEPEYPTCRDAITKLMNADAMSVAISIEVALVLHPVNGEVHIMYHNESVGAVNTDSNELLIREEFFWLEDTLNEVIIL